MTRHLERIPENRILKLLYQHEPRDRMCYERPRDDRPKKLFQYFLTVTGEQFNS